LFTINVNGLELQEALGLWHFVF